MQQEQELEKRICSLSELKALAESWKQTSATIAFTNGCFDVLHAGHIASLTQASGEADKLIVAINSDRSVRQLKGEGRPVNDEKARATVMAALRMVDAVIIFDEPTPIDVIKHILPDVLVKGGDYTVDQIAGAAEVVAAGGRVVINPILAGFSTTSVIEKIKKNSSSEAV